MVKGLNENLKVFVSLERGLCPRPPGILGGMAPVLTSLEEAARGGRMGLLSETERSSVGTQLRKG